MMNEPLRISNDHLEQPTVSGRELHQKLGISAPYSKWLSCMDRLGFTEGRDWEADGQDHFLSIDMAMTICRGRRSDDAQRCLRFLQEIHRFWNGPECLLSRSMRAVEEELQNLRARNLHLRGVNAVQRQQITELKPKPSYCDVILSDPIPHSISVMARDYGWCTRKMSRWLSRHGIQRRQDDIWLLEKEHEGMGYTRTVSHTYTGKDGMPHMVVRTYWTQKGRLFLYAMLRADGHLPLMEQETDE